jgi:hypothetical protein
MRFTGFPYSYLDEVMRHAARQAAKNMAEKLDAEIMGIGEDGEVEENECKMGGTVLLYRERWGMNLDPQKCLMPKSIERIMKAKLKPGIVVSLGQLISTDMIESVEEEIIRVTV